MRVLSDTGTYDWIVPGWDAMRPWLERRRLAGVARFPPARAVLRLAAARRYDALVVERTGPAWRTTLLLSALTACRRLVAIHFIDHPPPSGRARRALHRLWRPVDRAATRRALLVAHVLTEPEGAAVQHRFALPSERVRHVPFALRRHEDDVLPPPATESRVVSAGRAHCDWPTLFAAARGADWPLTVVCSAQDREEVDRLNADGRATVICEIPREECARILRTAAVVAVVMREEGVSQGHVRLMDAVDAGAAIVATRTRSLDGYAVDGETALLVPARDPAALREATDGLLADPAERARLREAAFERGREWTGPQYLEALAEMVRSAARART